MQLSGGSVLLAIEKPGPNRRFIEICKFVLAAQYSAPRIPITRLIRVRLSVQWACSSDETYTFFASLFLLPGNSESSLCAKLAV